MLWGAIDGTSEFACVPRPSANLRTAPMSRLAFGSLRSIMFITISVLISVASKARLPQPDVGEGRRAGEHHGSHALADRCVLCSLCRRLGSAFQKVLTTNRVVSSDWVTHQHCPKIARARQFFTIT